MAAEGKHHLLIINPPPTDLGGLPLLPDFPWPWCTGLVYEPAASFELKRVYSKVLEFASFKGENRHSWKSDFALALIFFHSLYKEAGGASTALRKQWSTLNITDREERIPPKCQCSWDLGVFGTTAGLGVLGSRGHPGPLRKAVSVLKTPRPCSLEGVYGCDHFLLSLVGWGTRRTLGSVWWPHRESD